MLLSVPGDRRRRELADSLEEAGFEVLCSSSWTAALELMAGHAIDLGIVDTAVSDYHTAPPRTPRDGPAVNPRRPTGELPLIFLVEDPAAFDWDAYARLDRAEIATSAIDQALVRRVCALADRLDRQDLEHQADDQLRIAVRGISAAIRTSDEPAVIARRLVGGIGGAFAVDQVHFITLEDDRVPEFSVQWTRKSDELVPLDTRSYRSTIRCLVERLWEGGTTFQTTDGDELPPGPDLVEMVGWAARLGARASISVPVGDGNAPFGILWLADTGRRRSWSALEISLLQHLAGNVAHAVTQAQVVTGQREVLRRLERLNRSKNDFLTTVNHELRTPLTSLTAYLDLLQDGTGGELPPAAAEMLGVVQRNANRLGGLIDDVLTVSRIAAGDPEMAWAQVPLSTLTREVLARLGPVAVNQGVDLLVSLPATEIVVDADARHLEQVLVHLVDNAVKFTDVGGRVHVEITEPSRDGEPVVEITVTDTGIGIGIPEEEVPELFTSFFRGSNAQGSAKAGSGLGLAIAHGLVEAHRGLLTVDALPTGGTRARVRMPVHRGQPHPDLEQPPPR